jgi:hypothetical protein
MTDLTKDNLAMELARIARDMELLRAEAEVCVYVTLPRSLTAAASQLGPDLRTGKVHLTRLADAEHPRTLCGRRVEKIDAEWGDETLSGLAATCQRCRRILGSQKGDVAREGIDETGSDRAFHAELLGDDDLRAGPIDVAGVKAQANRAKAAVAEAAGIGITANPRCVGCGEIAVLQGNLCRVCRKTDR